LKPIEYNNNPRSRYVKLGEDGEAINVADENGNVINYDKEAHGLGLQKGSRTNVGFAAQEVQELLTAITGGDAYGSMVYDNRIDNPNVTDEGCQLGLAYEKLIPMLVSVIQEQQKEIDEIKKRI